MQVPEQYAAVLSAVRSSLVLQCGKTDLANACITASLAVEAAIPELVATQGWFKGNAHSWNMSNGVIIDLTAKQFSDDLPEVLCTEKCDERYESCGPLASDVFFDSLKQSIAEQYSSSQRAD